MIRNTSERLNAKTLDQMFINMVEHGYDCPPFVSNAILQIGGLNWLGFLFWFQTLRFYLRH